MRTKKQTHTRTISSKLGILGIFGFFGFTGFLPRLLHITDVFTAPSFFLFFCFFGFFGFYYEGKMSGTFIDERFQSNIYRAESIAHKIALYMIIIITILTMSMLRLSTYDMLSVLIATIGFAFGLSLFLQSFLLYRYEHEE